MVQLSSSIFQLPASSLPVMTAAALVALWCLTPALANAEEMGGDNGEQVQEQPQCSTYIKSEERSDAHALTLHGINCFEAERYSWALTHYSAAFELDPDPFLFGAIGRSLHELGLFEPAMGYYQRFLDEDDAPSGADRIRQRVEELQELSKTEATVVSLRSAPSGATAYVVLDNGEWYELGTTPVEVELREGDYDFVFDADRYHPRQIEFHVEYGQENRVDGHLISEEAALGVSESSRRTSGVWMMATGLAAASGGATMLVLSQQNNSAAQGLEDNEFDDLSDYDERRRRHLDRADTYQTWGTISTAVGATALLGGFVLYVSASSSSQDSMIDDSHNDEDMAPVERSSLSLKPVVGLNHLGMRLHF